MKDYKPSLPFITAFKIMTPQTVKEKGVTVKTHVESQDTYYCTFKTFGGTEREVNGVLTVEDTATIETWYTPEITSNCNIKVDNTIYEILGTPENISKRNQYLVFKVRAVKGGV